MKKRNGFVSNSSSSSFVVELSKLSDKQIKQLENHMEHAINYGRMVNNISDAKGLENCFDNEYGIYNKKDNWEVRFNKEEVKCATLMTNLDLIKFACDEFGIKFRDMDTTEDYWFDQSFKKEDEK